MTINDFLKLSINFFSQIPCFIRRKIINFTVNLSCMKGQLDTELVEKIKEHNLACSK